MIQPSVKNETAQLNTLVLGIANDFGGTPKLEDVYDPKSKEHVIAGTFPLQAAVNSEMKELEEVLLKYGVTLLRPRNIAGVNQIYARDIGFVIDETFVIPNIIDNRLEEATGIDEILTLFPETHLVKVDAGARIEGGDVMPWNEVIFVGYSEDEDFNKYKSSRTNRAGVAFLRKKFPKREVIAFELNKSDDDPKLNALHLDCCFQPIGSDQAIIYRGGFKKNEDADFLINYFGDQKIIEIDQMEMYSMYSNIFSISPTVIVSCHSFTRLNSELENRGFTVEKINYEEIAKMEGLLRCSTMPIIRE